MNKIKSWIGKNVRIKEEYITDGWVNVPGLSAYFCGIERETFKVRMDCYGVDLFGFRGDGVDISEMPKPSHQIIITTCSTQSPSSYPFLWDAKYFEIV